MLSDFEFNWNCVTCIVNCFDRFVDVLVFVWIFLVYFVGVLLLFRCGALLFVLLGWMFRWLAPIVAWVMFIVLILDVCVVVDLLFVGCYFIIDLIVMFLHYIVLCVYYYWFCIG